VQQKSPLPTISQDFTKQTAAPGEYPIDKIALNSRIFIIEGISGSGKDTLQIYLNKTFAELNVYDYSEGDVLHSWKQLQIDGISELRVKLMKYFVKYMRDILDRDENAVFLLNRFHLSTYASTIIDHPELEDEYGQIINGLRALPVHILVLQLDENEIEQRSLHPERSGAWRKFQEQIVQKHGFRERLQRQQTLILQTAKQQQIPYSIIKLSIERELGSGQVRISEIPSLVPPIEVTPFKIRKRKKRLPPTNPPKP